ncbi:hypothetical protein ACP70R_021959 [Stipagrostis hirtigluma subsp. patula]
MTDQGTRDDKGKQPLDDGDDEIRMTVKDIPSNVSQQVKNLFNGLKVNKVEMNRKGKIYQCDIIISGSNSKASDAIKKLKGTKTQMNDSKMMVSFSNDTKTEMAGHQRPQPEEVVYRIGTEGPLGFMISTMKLRDILTDHGSPADILDGHQEQVLSCHRRHPLLAQQQSNPKNIRWVHIKLEVVEEGMKTPSCTTTLVMKADNVYIHGFINQKGVLYELVDKDNKDNKDNKDKKDNKDNKDKKKTMFLEGKYHEHKFLQWGLRYGSILGMSDKGEIVKKLRRQSLGKGFAESAVRVLSGYSDGKSNEETARVKLAGLIMMICESARMNPLHNIFLQDWQGGMKGWACCSEHSEHHDDDMLLVWEYQHMSSRLRDWKRENYSEDHPMSQLLNIYLVLNEPVPKEAETAGDNKGIAGQGGDVERHGQSSSAGSGSRPENRKTGKDNSNPGQKGSASGGGGKYGKHVVRRRVEVLAVRADLEVVGTTIVVYDGKRGQIIYTKQKPGEKGKMEKLELTGPYRGISASGRFTIEVNIPPTAGGETAESSGGKGDGERITWDWDGYNPDVVADEVDAPEPIHRTISRGPGRTVEVTYAVMSDALEGTVLVRLPLKDGGNPGVHGKIAARIGNFTKKSMLFRRTREKSVTCDSGLSEIILPLARSVVAVPVGCSLEIRVDLWRVVTPDNPEDDKPLQGIVKFEDGLSSGPLNLNNGDIVEVNVTWYPELDTAIPAGPGRRDEEYVINCTLGTEVYNLGTGEEYTKFIEKLREELGEGVLELEINGRTVALPVLPKLKKPIEQNAWLYIKLEVMEGDKCWTTALAVRKDNVYITAFTNQTGEWFELPGTDRLPETYEATQLSSGWGVSYTKMLTLNDLAQVERTLMSTRLGKDFVKRAVRRLSCHPHRDNGDEIPTGLGLAGLVLLICEAARMNPFLRNFADGWNEGTGLSRDLPNLMWNWRDMSAALQHWRKTKIWDSRCYISKDVASQTVSLVLNETEVKGSHRLWVEIFVAEPNFDAVGLTVTVSNTNEQDHRVTYKQENKQGQVLDGLLPKYIFSPNDPVFGVTSGNIYSFIAKDDKQNNICPVYLMLTEIGKRLMENRELEIRFDIPTHESIRSKISVTAGAKPVPRIITDTSDPNRKIDVTYLVTPKALMVEVKLRLKGDPQIAEYLFQEPEDGDNTYTAHGIIAARIGDFQQRIVLLGPAPEGVKIPSYSSLVPLERPAVVVPLGMPLHIDLAGLVITSGNGKVKQRQKHSPISFKYGQPTPTPEVNDDLLEVNIVWNPRQGKTVDREPDEVYTIGDKDSYSAFIHRLRRMLKANHCSEDVLEDYEGPALPNTRDHPVLATPGAKQEKQWIHIKLQVVEGEETSSTTLAIWSRNFYGVGFMNESKVWYGFRNQGGDPILPQEYNSIPVCDISYASLLYPVKDWKEMVNVLDNAKLGKHFAMNAVRTLSRYPDVEDGKNHRLELVGLLIMICESVRLNPIHDAVVDGWDNGARFIQRYMGYIWNWGAISRALLIWKDRGYKGWLQDWHLEKFGIKGSKDALEVIHLVFNDRRPIKPQCLLFQQFFIFFVLFLLSNHCIEEWIILAFVLECGFALAAP